MTRHLLLLTAAILLGIVARIWEFGRLPPGLNPDEASAAVDAVGLLRYGQDRNAISFPVKFTSWGSGQDALYEYLLLPVLMVLGRSPVAIRLPMLASAVATLPLAYLVTRRVFGAGTALMATFMLAICPWHILLSRWGLDGNLLPFVFLAGFLCLLMIMDNGWWFVPACLLFALSLYAYGTAYLVVPIFAVGSLFLIRPLAFLRFKHVWAGAATFGAVSAPIALLLAVNTFGLGDIRIGPFTVPEFPVSPRWETTTLLGAGDFGNGLTANIASAVRLIVNETDGIPYNVVEPFGIFYRSLVVLAAAGLIAALARRPLSFERRLLCLWLGAAAAVPLFQTVNINRFNVIFIPMILFGAYAIHRLTERYRVVASALVLAMLCAFGAFTAAYHGTDYKRVVAGKFQQGLIPALRAAQTSAQATVCVTDKINMPYIYTLFTDPISPTSFQATVKYVDPQEPLRRVESYGRYVFGSRRCETAETPTYVLTATEIPPRLGNRYLYEFFDNFVVYTPRP